MPSLFRVFAESGDRRAHPGFVAIGRVLAEDRLPRVRQCGREGVGRLSRALGIRSGDREQPSAARVEVQELGGDVRPDVGHASRLRPPVGTGSDAEEPPSAASAAVGGSCVRSVLVDQETGCRHPA